MPNFETGLYVITNCLYHNNAALLSSNSDEAVRGIPPIDGELRDVEKVKREIKRFHPDRLGRMMCKVVPEDREAVEQIAEEVLRCLTELLALANSQK